MHGEEFGAVGNASDRRECSGMVTDVLVDRRRDEKRARAAHQQRVAVRLRGCDRSGSDRAAGPDRPVLHDHGLSENGRHLVRQQPRHDIRRPACGRRHDQPDRPIRERLRARRYQQQMRNQRDQNGDHFLLHAVSPERQANPGDEELTPMRRNGTLRQSLLLQNPRG